MVYVVEVYYDDNAVYETQRQNFFVEDGRGAIFGFKTFDAAVGAARRYIETLDIPFDEGIEELKLCDNRVFGYRIAVANNGYMCGSFTACVREIEVI